MMCLIASSRRLLGTAYPSDGDLRYEQAPQRVVCTGYGDGGARAELCGIWAAVAYPLAIVRVIAFGAPTVMPPICMPCIGQQPSSACNSNTVV
jgi:hypothetical protein